jgi:hypothetical protein
MNEPSQPAPIRQLPSSSASGCGCFATGCLSLLGVLLFVLVILGGTAWYLGNKAIREFTSTQPSNVAVVQPTDEQYAAANTKLNDLRTAVRTKKAATISFTAEDLNALLARHPDFASRRGKTRIEIGDSLATVEMSVPLDTMDFGQVKHRWFNGRASFGFVYSEDGFDFDPRWIEANGRRISSRVLDWIAWVFNRNFSSNFENAIKDDEDAPEFWKNVKTMGLDGDKLVVITKGS